MEYANYRICTAELSQYRIAGAATAVAEEAVEQLPKLEKAAKLLWETLKPIRKQAAGITEKISALVASKAAKIKPLQKTLETLKAEKEAAKVGQAMSHYDPRKIKATNVKMGRIRKEIKYIQDQHKRAEDYLHNSIEQLKSHAKLIDVRRSQVRSQTKSLKQAIKTGKLSAAQKEATKTKQLLTLSKQTRTQALAKHKKALEKQIAWGKKPIVKGARKVGRGVKKVGREIGTAGRWIDKKILKRKGVKHLPTWGPVVGGGLYEGVKKAKEEDKEKHARHHTQPHHPIRAKHPHGVSAKPRPKHQYK
jgi:archaellum component FlaC